MAKSLVAERFWNKVDKSGTCWLWTAGQRNASGYGGFLYNGKHSLAHRVSYEIEIGPVPDGLLVLHRCDNPLCVRPSHLFLGTNDDNMKDMAAKGRSPKGDNHCTRLRPELVRKGEAAPNARLTEDKVKEIRRRYNNEEAQALALDFGVSRDTIYGIVYRKKWKHVP